MKLLITGARAKLSTPAQLRSEFMRAADRVLGLTMEDRIECVIHGREPTGIDAIADAWAHNLGFEVQSIAAEWQRLGKRAGVVRNQRLIDELEPTFFLALPARDSIGTWDCVRRCVAAKLPGIIWPGLLR